MPEGGDTARRLQFPTALLVLAAVYDRRPFVVQDTRMLKAFEFVGSSDLVNDRSVVHYFKA